MAISIENTKTQLEKIIINTSTENNFQKLMLDFNNIKKIIESNKIFNWVYDNTLKNNQDMLKEIVDRLVNQTNAVIGNLDQEFRKKEGYFPDYILKSDKPAYLLYPSLFEYLTKNWCYSGNGAKFATDTASCSSIATLYLQIYNSLEILCESLEDPLEQSPIDLSIAALVETLKNALNIEHVELYLFSKIVIKDIEYCHDLTQYKDFVISYVKTILISVAKDLYNLFDDLEVKQNFDDDEKKIIKKIKENSMIKTSELAEYISCDNRTLQFKISKICSLTNVPTDTKGIKTLRKLIEFGIITVDEDN